MARLATPQEDAIARLLAQQAAAQGSLANTAAVTNAPAGALEAVQSIPNSMSQTLQAQQQARSAQEAERNAGINAASQAGIAQMIASIAESGKLQSNMDTLRQQWAQSDIAGKMNLAQEQGRNQLAQIEAMRQKEAEEAAYRAQEHAYRMSSAGGRGGSGSDDDWLNTASGQRLLYDMQRNEGIDLGKSDTALGETKQAVWEEYAALRDADKPAGEAWRKTLTKYDALGTDAVSRSIQDYIRKNAKVNYKPKPAPTVLNWGEQFKKKRAEAQARRA